MTSHRDTPQAIAEALKRYRAQHDANCSKHHCSVCGVRHRNKRIAYGKHDFHDFSGHPCTCGLADALAALASPTGAEQELATLKAMINDDGSLTTFEEHRSSILEDAMHHLNNAAALVEANEALQRTVNDQARRLVALQSSALKAAPAYQCERCQMNPACICIGCHTMSERPAEDGAVERVIAFVSPVDEAKARVIHAAFDNLAGKADVADAVDALILALKVASQKEGG